MPPATLFLERDVQTRLDLIKPDINKRVCANQAQQKIDHDKCTKVWNFSVGERVMNFRAGTKWISATLTQQDGPLTTSSMVSLRVASAMVSEVGGKASNLFS